MSFMPFLECITAVNKLHHQNDIDTSIHWIPGHCDIPKMYGGMVLHTGGDGRINGVGTIVNVEISKEVVRVERWQGRIIAAWIMIR